MLERAEVVLERERLRVAGIGIEGELLLTGGSCLPGAMTGGDADLHLRVPPRTFEATVSATFFDELDVDESG